MADRIAVISEGRLQQVGHPQAVYDRPAQPLRGPLHRHPADEHRRRGRRPGRSRLTVTEAEPTPTSTPRDRRVHGRRPPVATRATCAEPRARHSGPPGRPRSSSGFAPSTSRSRPRRPATRSTEWCATSSGWATSAIVVDRGRRAPRCRAPGHRPAPAVRRRPGAARGHPKAIVHLFDPAPRSGSIDGAEACEPSRPPGAGAPATDLVEDRSAAYACLAPSLIVFAMFFYYPLYRLFYVEGTHQSNRSAPATATSGSGHSLATCSPAPTSPTASAHHAPLRRLHGPGRAWSSACCWPWPPTASSRASRSSRRIFSSTVATSVAVASVVFFMLINPAARLLQRSTSAQPAQTPARCSGCRCRRCGRTSASRSSSCWPGCRPSPTSCSRPPPSTATARSAASSDHRAAISPTLLFLASCW